MTFSNALIDTLLWTMAISIAVPLIVFGSECLLAMLRKDKKRPLERVASDTEAIDPKSRAAVDVIIPAHNEQLGLVRTLDSVTAALRPGDHLYLVADNCSDNTAEIAHQFAANLASRSMTVLERLDSQNRGKDYALRFAFDALDLLTPPESIASPKSTSLPKSISPPESTSLPKSTSPPESTPQSDRVVVIVDADCKVWPDTIDRLAIQVTQTQRPAQACYLMQQPESIPITPPGALSEFAFTVKNFVRPLGLTRIGGGCTLFGSGMAFPRHALKQLSAPGGHLVEDMRWTFDMILAGYPVQYCPDAKCLATFPTHVTAADTQRRRWEHGHLQLIGSQVPRLIRGWTRNPTRYCLLAALDLVVLPLSLLMIAAAIIGTLLAIAAWLGYAIGPLVTWLIAMSIASVGLGLAWARFCPRRATMGMIFAIPFYAIRKLPLYTSFIFHPERVWIRTDRN
ncbi:glycosyl transferase family 2 [Rhodopirellula maiorica SM1]|uniref:Glycosyl transferase family 2 n=2 Tax=Novipirellula TaxID=2795426 RepID=M5RBP4_9BACT|nr:glycosyl transferase family 2 [Rhodopirellula maiorica SM1]